MAEEAPNAASGEATAEEASSALSLDDIVRVTPQTKPEAAKDLLQNLVEKVMDGTVKYDRNLTRTISQAIDSIDKMISKQLAEVMHHEELQKLEGSWRGFQHLVANTSTGKTLKIKVLNVSKRDLFKDLDKAVEFDQSQLFKKIYEYEFGLSGGEPYGALIGDYEFTRHPEDVEMLEKISGVASAAFCPFIGGASAKLFGFEDFTELSKPKDIGRLFEAGDYMKWRSFRDSEDSRFVSLAMPRVLSRLPYGKNTKPIEEFNYEEAEVDDLGVAKSMDHNDYTWMNAAYVIGAKLTESFANYGWCTSIRGAEGGGKVEGLPTHLFTSDDGDQDAKCPTEIAITDRRENELTKAGFLPLCHYKNTNYAVIFGGQTTQQPKKFDDPDASANAAISAGLPYIMAVSRIAHYLKVIARDKIGSKMDRGDVEDFLKRWIATYVCADEKPSADMKAKFPLAEAEVEVREVPGQPGFYDAVAWLRPWLFFEELNASLRLVAKIPKKK